METIFRFSTCFLEVASNEITHIQIERKIKLPILNIDFTFCFLTIFNRIHNNFCKFGSVASVIFGSVFK